MKQIAAVLVGIFACAHMVFPQAGTEESVKVKSLVGKVEVHTPGTAAWRPARPGMPIRTKWDVRTFVESTVELEFETGSIVRINENSVVNLSNLAIDKATKARNTGLKVASGQVVANVKKLVGTGSDFQFETPTAVASIRGTQLAVGVDGARTTVDVYEGKVSVRNKESKSEVMVGRRGRAVIEAGNGNIGTFTFDDLKGNGGPALNPYASDSLSHRDSAAVDSSGKGPVDSVRVDSAAVDTAQGIDSTKTDSTIIDTVRVDSAAVVDTVAKDSASQTGATQGGDTANVVVPKDTVAQSPVVPDTAGNGAEAARKAAEEEAALAAATNDTVTTSAGSTTVPLVVTAPAAGGRVDTTLVTVSGRSTPGATVTVDGTSVTVRGDGSFSYILILPDEPGPYTVTVTAEKDGGRSEQRRAFTYERHRAPLALEVKAPVNGSQVKTATLKVSGLSSSGAVVTVNGRAAVMGSGGVFSADIQITESMIGDLAIEVVAEDRAGGQELRKNLLVHVDPTSAAVNTTVPQLSFQGSLAKGVAQNNLGVNIIDRTIDDQLELSVSVNGSVDIRTVESGAREKIDLEPGLNKIQVKAKDRAGNQAAPLSAELYYLPGPLTIAINQPEDNPMIITDRPPLIAGTNRMRPIPLEIELDDNIGNASQSIASCTANGKPLKQSGYLFTGTLDINPTGTTTCEIVATDLSGRFVKKTLTVSIDP